MTKIVGYTPLLYGREFLGYAIKSIIDYVDRYYCLYTPQGSHTVKTLVPCPETRDELYAIASAAAGNKLVWHEGVYDYEGQHRGMIHELAPDADVILALDADEIWPAHINFGAISTLGFRHIRLPMIHLWRSFNKAILHDPAYPTRIICPKQPEGDWTASNTPPIVHCGYAQTPPIVQYKWLVHGHINELRRDCDWFKDIYLNKERSTDLHPVGSDAWNYERVNWRDYMPSFMAQHPFYNLEWIE